MARIMTCSPSIWSLYVGDWRLHCVRAQRLAEAGFRDAMQTEPTGGTTQSERGPPDLRLFSRNANVWQRPCSNARTLPSTLERRLIPVRVYRENRFHQHPAQHLAQVAARIGLGI